MSRLPFAPPLKEIAVTEVKKGLAVFTPKPAAPVSFAALKNNLKKAGYALASAEITVAGKLAREGEQWLLIVAQSQQRFIVAATTTLEADQEVELSGAWKTVGKDEVLTLPPAKPASQTENVDVVSADPLGAALAPIRTTSPGLTVYRGGALTARYNNVRQSLGALRVTRRIVNLAASFTPTPQLQLAAELPLTQAEFKDGQAVSDGAGLGNLTVWAKYRFYRVVGEWGDRQASARFGLETPTGAKTAPGAQQVRAAEFVRQQLTPSNGGWSPHFDLAYSQAKGRLIFGGNAEMIVRGERDGYRLGHELHLNTDLEYVLFPFRYRRPTGELFGLLETSFVKRGQGRLNGQPVAGSRSTEFFLAPGLQYVANARLTFEFSWQLPVARNVGAQLLRTDRSLLVGCNFLF